MRLSADQRVLLWMIGVSLLSGDDSSALGMSLINPDSQVDVPKTCTMERVYKMLGYVCSNLNLKEVPQYLKSSVEILDISFNRIRDLSPQSFANYDSIKLLYIFENLLQTIEPNTFSRLQSLEAIDLSTNALTTIPRELFDLPLLRNLYISENSLIHLSSDLKDISKPIRAPLVKLSLSKCRLMAIPDFGPLPELHTLNVSQNNLSTITPQDFSPFCVLQEVHLNQTSVPMCMCHQINLYLNGRRIRTIGAMNCDTQPADIPELIYCADPQNATVESPAFETCTSMVKIKRLQEETHMTWITVVACLFGFFVVFMSILYWFHRRSVRQMQRNKTTPMEVAKKSMPINVAKELRQNAEGLLVKEDRV